MLFSIKNKRRISIEQLRANTLMSAYFIIKNYPMNATELLLDSYIQQQHGSSLKNMCIELLLNLVFYEDDSGNLILLFKNTKYDSIASLITYGNGAIPGSSILQAALKN
jgi:hypothetical protein